MRKRRFSITDRQAESICAALTLAIEEAKVERSYSPYWKLRIKEWEELGRNLANYKWEVE